MRCLIGILVVAGAAPLLGAATSQTFRTRAEGVVVDVSVRSGGKPVAGLTAADFEVRDNGRLQAVTDVSLETLPVDVTVIVDVSNEALYEKRLGALSAALRRLTTAVDPGDRLRVLADGTYVSEVGPAGLVPGGGSSTCDAFVMALMQKPEPGRRQMVIALTEGIDYMSVTDVAIVPEVAKRSDALLHVVTARSWTGGNGRGRLTLPPTAGALIEAARLTGGDTQDLGDDIASTVRKILRDFRQSYLVRYQPQGVDGAGWHELEVKVTKPGKYEVRARKGYVGV